MEYGKLRIVWSVFWGLLTVLLLGLWMRSYCWTGQEVITLRYFGSKPVGLVWNSQGTGVLLVKVRQSGPPIVSEVGMPYWLSLPLLIAVVVAGWLPWQFSLRSLLITTTLVAVGLGLIVWASQ